MDEKILYLLQEVSMQEDFEIEAKYLYKGKVNNEIVQYLEDTNSLYLYLSINNGIIEPNEVIKPYRIKKLSNENNNIWRVCALALLKEYIKQNGIKKICILYRGKKFEKIEKMIEDEIKVEYPFGNFGSDKLILRWIGEKSLKSLYKIIERRVEMK